MIQMLGGMLDIGGKLIDRLWSDPQQRDKAKLELISLQQSGELAELETAMAAIVAEAQSQDKWTSRARPAFLYLIYVVILLCVLGGIVGIWHPEPVAQAAENIQALLAAIPDELWWLFGTGYLGYSAARSYDKGKIFK